MKRSELRADPEKTRAWQDRSRRRAAERQREKPRKPLPVESEKRKRERPTRAKVAAAAKARGCAGRELVPEVACWGPLDADEIVSRGRRPGGHLDPDNVWGLCRGHHEWKGLHPDEAHARGLWPHSWEDTEPTGD